MPAQTGTRRASAPRSTRAGATFRPVAAAFVLALTALAAQGGCRMTSGFAVSRSTAAGPPATVAHANGSGVTTSGLDPSGPDAIDEDSPSRMSRTILRDQLLPLRGMTVEQARQRLKQLGFAGTVNVYNHGAFMDGCTDDKVCFTQPSDGLELEGNIDLYMNAKLTIAPPPP